MSNQLAVPEQQSVIEQVVINGDLSKLSPEQRVKYYMSVCQSVGLNPLTKPFDYITLNGRLTLYAKKDATDQLRKSHSVSIKGLECETINGVYVVRAHASDASGRSDVSTGAVNIEGLKGDALANALMKAETKAKRRVTLSICGLGMLDETEIETIQDARRPVINDVIDGNGGNGNGNGHAVTMTLDDARNTKTSKGDYYGTLTADQLLQIADHPKASAQQRTAARMCFDALEQAAQAGAQ